MATSPALATCVLSTRGGCGHADTSTRHSGTRPVHAPCSGGYCRYLDSCRYLHTCSVQVRLATPHTTRPDTHLCKYVMDIIDIAITSYLVHSHGARRVYARVRRHVDVAVSRGCGRRAADGAARGHAGAVPAVLRAGAGFLKIYCRYCRYFYCYR